jgi:hypothetical protein
MKDKLFLFLCAVYYKQNIWIAEFFQASRYTRVLNKLEINRYLKYDKNLWPVFSSPIKEIFLNRLSLRSH